MFKFTDFMTRSVRTLRAMVFGALLLFGSIEAAAQTHNCWCEIKCTSDQNGQTYTQSAKSVGPAFSWPITPAKHDQCSNRCLGLAQDEGKIVADAGKLCKTGNCSGKSWIGTEIGGFRMTINNVDFNNTDKPYCKGPTGSGCCPGYLENANLLQMSKHESAAGGNVTETILTGSPQFSELIAAIQAQLNLLKHSACAAGQNLSVRLTFTHWNTNSITAPIAPSTSSWTAAGQFTVNIPAAGLAGLAGPGTGTWAGGNSTAFSIPVNPNYYVIMASAVVVGSRGQELKCGDFDGTCFNKLRFRDVYNPAANFKSANPLAATNNRQAF